MSQIYTHPDLDAAVAIERRGGVFLLDFLAKGRSQKKRAGKVVGYTLRNPDRRALVDNVLASLADAYPKLILLGASGGKGAPLTVFEPPVLIGNPAVRQAYSRAGNYRWRVWVRPHPGRAALTPTGFALVLGLERDEQHRPVTTDWPEELSL